MNEVFIAGAGSGKTYSLINKAIELSKEYSEKEIVIISFTNKAVEEIDSRLTAKLSIKGDFVVGTFHQLAIQWLKKMGIRIRKVLLPEEAQDIMQRISKELGESITCREAIQVWNVYSKKLETHRDYTVSDIVNLCRVNLSIFLVHEIINRYIEIKKSNHFMDFPQLMNNLYKKLSKKEDSIVVQNDISVVMVDEAQDINAIQYDILKLLNRRLIMFGDDWQSIYGFRGGCDKYMIEFAAEPTTLKTILPYNYRSYRSIVDFSSNIMSERPGDARKQIAASDIIGSVAIHQTTDLFDYILSLNADKSYTILALKNQDLLPIAECLQKNRIPYLYDCKTNDPELQQYNRYLQYFLTAITVMDNDVRELLSIIFADYNINEMLHEMNSFDNDIPRIRVYIEKFLTETLKLGPSSHDAMHNANPDREESEIFAEPRFILSTIHSSKGLEWDNVIVIHVDQMNFNDKDDEKRRLLYVACSRAKKTLQLLYRTKITKLIKK